MKFLFHSSCAATAVVTLLMVINIYDYLFRDDLPWREGDFSSVMTRLLAALFFTLAIAIYTRRKIRQDKTI